MRQGWGKLSQNSHVRGEGARADGGRNGVGHLRPACRPLSHCSWLLVFCLLGGASACSRCALKQQERLWSCSGTTIQRSCCDSYRNPPCFGYGDVNSAVPVDDEESRTVALLGAQHGCSGGSHYSKVLLSSDRPASMAVWRGDRCYQWSLTCPCWAGRHSPSVVGRTFLSITWSFALVASLSLG